MTLREAKIAARRRDWLTWRERTVCRQLARDGAPDRVIARRLDISYETARTYIKTAMACVGVTTRTALALWWIREGQYLPEDPYEYQFGTHADYSINSPSKARHAAR